MFGAWKPEQSGMRLRTASHGVFAKWGLQLAMFTPGASNIRRVDMSTVTAYVHLVFEKTSKAGYGGTVPRIVYSHKKALDSAISRQRLE